MPGRAAGWLAAAVLAVGGLGALVQSLAAGRDPVPGRLVDVGGHRLHVHCLGEGRPTVVLEMGAGKWSVHGARLQASLAGTTRTCVYDRAGYGWSEPGPEPRTVGRLASELHALLAAAGEEGPYVLAGHSLGGWVARVYTRRHPGDVAGVALLDAAHERQWEELPPEVGEFLDRSVDAMAPAELMVRLGIMRLLPGLLPLEDLGPERTRLHRQGLLRPSWWSTMASESRNARLGARRVAAAGDLGSLPLTVMSAGRSFDAFRSEDNDIPYREANRVWMRLQRDLANLSADARHLVSLDASHEIYADDPGLVVRGILDVVARARERGGEAFSAGCPTCRRSGRASTSVPGSP